MPRSLLHLLFFLFLAAFIGIVILADRGQGFWGFLNHVPGGDKLGHFGLLGTFSLLLNLVLKGRRSPRPLQRLLLGSGLLTIAMTLEELSQAFLPTRTLDLLDWLASLAGIAFGDIIARRRLHRSRQGKPVA